MSPNPTLRIELSEISNRHEGRMRLQTIKIDGHTVAYQDVGHGTPVILAHCSSASHKEWRALTSKTFTSVKGSIPFTHTATVNSLIVEHIASCERRSPARHGDGWAGETAAEVDARLAD